MLAKINPNIAVSFGGLSNYQDDGVILTGIEFSKITRSRSEKVRKTLEIEYVGSDGLKPLSGIEIAKNLMSAWIELTLSKVIKEIFYPT